MQNSTEATFQDYKSVKTHNGNYKGYGYKNRVWKCRVKDGSLFQKLESDTILECEDYKGNIEDVFASDIRLEAPAQPHKN